MISSLESLYPVAEDQGGYFTATQATSAGVSHARLLDAASQGLLERVSRGVYRLAFFPVSEHAEYHEAVLWPQVSRPITAVISHSSALALYGMSEVRPKVVHLTIPSGVRVRRKPPETLKIHHAAISPADQAVYEGVPVTTPARSLRDAMDDGLSPQLVRQAIIDGSQKGHLQLATAVQLAQQMLGEMVVIDQSGLVAKLVPMPK